MLATSHALAAGIILKLVPDPKIALPLAFISHFVLDLVPHWDVVSDRNRRGKPHQTHSLVGERDRFKLIFWAGLDVLLGFGLTFWLFSSLNPWLLFGAIILAQLPDWLEMPYYFWGLHLPLSVSTKKIQSVVHARTSLPWGLLIQLIVILPLLWWVLR